MCTLILGRDVLGQGRVLLAANRDEDPARPADPPGVLMEHPRLVGGRDRRAGGTWLALREGRAVVALLNRRERSGGPAAAPERRSRGALVLEVAGVTVDEAAAGGERGEPGVRGGPWEASEPLLAATAPGLPRAALRRALAAVHEAPYGPFTLLFASPEACWLLALEPDRPPRVAMVPAGWHVITHMDLDDPREPRASALALRLKGWAPRSLAEAEARLDELLRSHGDPTTGLPPVCLHQGRMVTVSASSVTLAPGEARYRHAEGRPCEHAFEDYSRLARVAMPRLE